MESDAHALQVAELYSHGAHKYGDFHGGYLNFGYWDDGNGNVIHEYTQAARELVFRIGILAGLNERSHVLDVACGYGAQDIYLYNLFGCHIDALDITPQHIQAARGRIHKNSCEKYVRAHEGTATNLTRFIDSSFTDVLCIEGVVHFDTRERFLREAYRVLKKNGVLTMADYCLKRPPKNIAEEFLLSILTKIWHIPKKNCVVPEEYIQKLSQIGFKQIQLELIGEKTIPGYCYENEKPECRTALRAIRGVKGDFGGRIMDKVVYIAFHAGLLEYILVRAVK